MSVPSYTRIGAVQPFGRRIGAVQNTADILPGVAALSGWAHRKRIRYPAGLHRPASDQTDFPFLVDIAADADIAAILASGGGITFTAADGVTEVPFGEYPDTDYTAGRILARLKISPDADAQAGDTIAYLYYDPDQTTVEDKAGTVSNGYDYFVPFEEDPSGGAPQMLDWVTETNVGTSRGTMTSGDLIAGQVGNALDFDGTNDGVNFGNTYSPGSGSLTWEAWFKTSSTSGDQEILRRDNSFLGQPIRSILALRVLDSTGYFSWLIRDASGTTDTLTSSVSVSDGAWHSAAGVKDTTNTLYKDGVSVVTATSTTGDMTSSPSDLTAGFWREGNDNFGIADWFSGAIDEIRISSVARSADWLKFAHVNDFAPAFTSFLGEEETLASSGNATVTLSALAGLGTLVAPSISVGLTTALTPLTTTNTVVAPVVSTASDTTVTPNPISGLGTITTETINSGVLLTPSPLVALGTITTETVTLGNLVTPNPLTSVGVIPDPTLTLGEILALTPLSGLGTVTTNVVTLGEVVQLSALVGTVTPVSPSVSVGVDTPVTLTPLTTAITLTTSEVIIAIGPVLSPLSGLGVVAAPTVQSGLIITTTPLTSVGVIPEPTTLLGNRVTPSPLTTTIILPSVSLAVGSLIQPSPLSGLGSIVAPLIYVPFSVSIDLSPLSINAALIAPIITQVGAGAVVVGNFGIEEMVTGVFGIELVSIGTIGFESVASGTMGADS